MLALSVLSKSWPVGGWVFRLFVNLITKLTGQKFKSDESNPGSTAIGNPRNDHNSCAEHPKLPQAASGGDMHPIAQANLTASTSLHHQQDEQNDDYFQQAADQLITEALWADQRFTMDFGFQNAPMLSTVLRNLDFNGEVDSVEG
jgi:hypothetical protein